MSDSDDLSTPLNIPPDAQIEACLHRITRLAVKNEEEVTTNIVRSRAEKELGLDSGFFKDTDAWKQRSRNVVLDALENDESPEKKRAPAKSAARGGKKRKSDSLDAPRKKSKPSPVEDSEASSVEPDVGPPASDAQDDSEHEEKDSPLSDVKDVSVPPPDATSRGNDVNDDSSDLSSVIDDAPPKKKRAKKSVTETHGKSTSTKSAKSTKTKATTTKDKATDASLDDEEIKRLQSWLLKCGVRKLWHRELAPYPTAKAKIAHLKDMLSEVGMTGRYSAEKAKQIKEARELKAELEAAQEFNEVWGDGAGQDSDEEGVKRPTRGVEAKPEPPKRLKPKGLVDFGDSDDESD